MSARNINPQFSMLFSSELIEAAATVLMLGIIVFALVRHYSENNASNRKVSTIANRILFSLVLLLWIPNQVIVGYWIMGLANKDYSIIEENDNLGELSAANDKITAIYQFLFFTSCVFSGTLIIRSFRNAMIPFTPKASQWVVLTLVTLVIAPTCIFIREIAYNFPKRQSTAGTNMALMIFERLSVTLTIFGILKSVYHSVGRSICIDVESNYVEKQ
jgi:hypothetical protein